MSTKLNYVCNAMIDQVESGAFSAGDRLPSEQELASNFGISVGTVQKALSRLASMGVVSREQGRGTFVLGSKVNPVDLRYLRFRDSAGNELPQYIHVLSVRRLKKRGPWSDFLGSDGRYIRIERMLSVGNRFDLYSEFWLSEADFGRLDDTDERSLEKNLRLLLGQKLSLPTLRVDQWIRFEPFPPAIEQRLDIESGSPGFLMEMRGYTLRDRPLFYQCIYGAPFSESLIIVR